MSKNKKAIKIYFVPMAARKLESIVKQIARIKSGESTSTFTMHELNAMREGLLAELNYGD